MSKNIKKILKEKMNHLFETTGFEDMEVAFGVKDKSDNLDSEEAGQFGPMETVEDYFDKISKKGTKLGEPSVQPALTKVHKEDKKDADDYYKEVAKRMVGFQKTDESEPTQIGEAFDSPKVNRKDDQTEPEDVYDTEALGTGMQALKYDNEGTEVHDKFEERMEDLNDGDATYEKLKKYSEKYLKHKYEDPDEYHYTPKVRVTDKPINEGMFGDDFEDIPNHRELIDGWLKDGNRKAINDYISGLNGPEKEDAQNYLKGKTSKSSDLREGYSDIGKENIFKVKGTIKNKKQIIKLVDRLPSRVRVDETVFSITDGQNSYRLVWEGAEDGEVIVTHEKNVSIVNESINKMRHLWEFKSSDSTTTKKNITESSDESFKRMFNKLKGKESLNETVAVNAKANKATINKLAKGLPNDADLGAKCRQLIKQDDNCTQKLKDMAKDNSNDSKLGAACRKMFK
jgi:hypothetical protein